MLQFHCSLNLLFATASFRFFFKSCILKVLLNCSRSCHFQVSQNNRGIQLNGQREEIKYRGVFTFFDCDGEYRLRS